jgi:hypothetical protein
MVIVRKGFAYIPVIRVLKPPERFCRIVQKLARRTGREMLCVRGWPFSIFRRKIVTIFLRKIGITLGAKTVPTRGLFPLAFKALGHQHRITSKLAHIPLATQRHGDVHFFLNNL